MWYKSKTLWFNVGVAVLVAIEATFPMLEDVLPVNIYAIGAIVLASGNAALRVIATVQQNNLDRNG